MGMFDSIYKVLSGKRISCAAGHDQIDVEMQTKDLECNFLSYYICNNKLYRSNNNPQTSFDLKDTLQIVHRTSTEPCSLTKSITVYGGCKICDPIIFERGGNLWGRVGERWVWCEWELFFEEGMLLKVEPVTLETRDQLRAKMLKGGCENILPDDDRVARKHLELLRTNKL